MTAAPAGESAIISVSPMPSPASTESDARDRLAAELCRTASGFHARGWMLGTSGNLSAVLQPEPLRLLITGSGVDKGMLAPEQILTVDEAGQVLVAAGHASDETRLHLAIVARSGAGSVLHTHSVWNNLAAERGALPGGLELSGHEMLKGLAGVSSHEHREWIPVLGNSQDYEALARAVGMALARHPRAHALLLHRHGLYAWGRDVAEARRHVEVLEFLFELTSRLAGAAG